MPLRDSFGRTHDYLRISVTDRCNLRCRYCMPAEGIAWRQRDQILTIEEIERLAKIFVGLGVRKIRLTGGEPTVRRGLVDLVARLATLPGLDTVAMTTNGLLLRDLVAPLREAGLSALNVSLDTLRPERFHALTRREGLEQVLAGIDAALAAGFAPLKLNVVVIADVNDDELLDFVELTRTRPLNVRFIEYMPFGGNGWRPERLVPVAAMREIISQRYDLGACPTSAAVAKDHGIPGHAGTVSFITPVSEDFCANCSRLRLGADGSLRSCLFRAGAPGLRELVQAGASDLEIAARIEAVLAVKARERPALSELHARGPSAMVEIGG